MAAGESAVNRASMAQAAQQVEAAVGVITGLQATMNGYTSQLRGGWQGNAAVAFTSAYEMFSEDFAKVRNALQVIYEKLVSTRNTYQATEDANTAKVNSVASLIGAGAAAGAATKGGLNIASNKVPAGTANQTPATTAGGNFGDDGGSGMQGAGGAMGGIGSSFGGVVA